MSEVKSSTFQAEAFDKVREAYPDEKIYEAFKALGQGQQEILKCIAESTPYRKEDAGERTGGQRESGSEEAEKRALWAAMAAFLAAESARRRKAHLPSPTANLSLPEASPVQPRTVPASPRAV